MGKKDADAEDLAIQNTLSMTVEERLELLAALIVDKIVDDLKQGDPLFNKIKGVQGESIANQERGGSNPRIYAKTGN